MKSKNSDKFYPTDSFYHNSYTYTCTTYQFRFIIKVHNYVFLQKTDMNLFKDHYLPTNYNCCCLKQKYNSLVCVKSNLLNFV